MFKYFGRCIFCSQALPSNPTGVGEHVIPQNIGGFWRVYDVCDDCMQYFGEKVDQLSIKHPWILHAMKQLNIQKAENYSQQLPYQGKDTIGGYPVEMIKKENGYKTKVSQYKDDFFECAEDDWEKIGMFWLRNSIDPNLDKNKVDNELEILKQKYKTLKPGETVTSEYIGFSVRKRQVKNVKPNEKELPSITPLIAKIVSVFLFYFLPPLILSSLVDLKALLDHARYNKPIRNYLINWCPIFEKEQYTKIHAIKIHSFGNSIILDISLFGYPNWRLLLNSQQQIFFEPVNKLNYDTLIFLLDFRDLDHKQKSLGVKPLDSSEYHYWDLNV